MKIYMKHIRTGFEGYFSTLGLNKGLAKGSHNKVFWAGALNAILNKQPFFAADPFIGCDMAIGTALRLTVKMDWLLAIRKTGLNMPHGPRI